MKRSSLIHDLQIRYKYMTHEMCEKAVELVFKHLAKALVEGNNIELRGFSTFHVRERKARTGRNPRTGEKVNISNRKSIKFKMSKELKSRINSGISEEEVNKKIELMYDNKKK